MNEIPDTIITRDYNRIDNHDYDRCSSILPRVIWKRILSLKLHIALSK
jgi:hypothetical protein